MGVAWTGSYLTETEDEKWQREQSDLLQLSSNSRQVFADQSGHNISFDQPAAAVGAIVKMFEQIRQPRWYERALLAPYQRGGFGNVLLFRYDALCLDGCPAGIVGGRALREMFNGHYHG